MTGPPAVRLASETTIRVVPKKARAFKAKGRVRVVGQDGALVDVCAGPRLQRYLAAPNAEIIRAHNGTVMFVRLLAFGDDRKHCDEKHGNSNRTFQGHTAASRGNPESTYHHKLQACEAYRVGVKQ